MPFSAKERADVLSTLAANQPELVIIGGGIVGCSIAAHAARLGLDCVLLEREDLASGASGSSTGLAHAGLRYLAQGQLLYVFHESRERQRLEDLAPHWVRPFSFILPAYKEDPYPFWIMRFGTLIYDLFTQVDNLLVRRTWSRGHRLLGINDICAKVPGLRTEGLRGGIEYSVDAKLQDARFTLGYAQQAARYGARVLTYSEALSVQSVSDQACRVECRDVRTGATFELFAKLVVNATGGWIDELRSTAGLSSPLVEKSKGIHLIVDQISSSPLIFSTPTKGKVFFVIPLNHECSLVGTTDTPLAVRPDQARAEPKDVQELLRQLFHFFPYLKQGPNLLEAIEAYKQVHVRSVTWGVRPLMRQPGPTIKASREHRLVKDRDTFWSIPGVKLTAARGAGREIARDAWKYIRPKVRMPSVSWDSLPGGEMWDYDRFVKDAQKRFTIGRASDTIIAHLVSTYGTRYVEVLQWANRDDRLREQVLDGEPWIYAEAAYAAHEEMVLTLNDFLWRRAKWALVRNIPKGVIERITAILGTYLEWSSDDQKREIQRFYDEYQEHLLPVPK